MLTCLIVEDHSAESLRRMIESIESIDAAVVAEVRTLGESLPLVTALSPQVLFLAADDPAMLKEPTVRTLLDLDNAPLMVALVGDREQAVEAYDLGVLDCIVRPCSPERLALTLSRARRHVENRAQRQNVEQRMLVHNVLQDGALRRLPLKSGRTVRLLRVDQFLYATNHNGQVSIVSLEGEFATSYSLDELTELLPAERFHRIHDSWIINLNLVNSIHRDPNGRYAVEIANGLKIPVAQSNYLMMLHLLQCKPTPDSKMGPVCQDSLAVSFINDADLDAAKTGARSNSIADQSSAQVDGK